MNGSSKFNRAALVAAVAMAFGATPLYAQSNSSASGTAGASGAVTAQGGSNSQQDPRNVTSQGTSPSVDRSYDADRYDANRYDANRPAATDRSSFGGNGMTIESERGERHMRAGSDGVPEPTSPLSGTGASGAGRSGVGVHDGGTVDYGSANDASSAVGTTGTSSMSGTAIDQDRLSAPSTDAAQWGAYGYAPNASPAEISRETGRADFGLGGPGRTGHDVQPTDMGPGSMRAE